ncbi:F-box/WD repeat-containing protein 4 [Sorex fumeus]|uniref:F-box/WD repeat-containing protein 4 n=1 Tax=Sorex fumeus TaxID=62283 RepID=UPI0024AE25DF|nr:F-box/WD repeat-containing protein 4 [Sorex fumeus]
MVRPPRPRFRVGPSPRPLPSSPSRPSRPPGPAGNCEAAAAAEGERREARGEPEGRVARGRRRKGKGKGKAAGPGGRGSGAQGKPAPRPVEGAAGRGAGAAGAGAGGRARGSAGEAGGRSLEGASRLAGDEDASSGAGASDAGQQEGWRGRSGRREGAQGPGGQAWGRGAGPGAAMAAAEAAAGAREPVLWRLPEELLLLICSYLDVRALGRLAQVCRWLRRFTSCDLLWRRIARASLNAGFSPLGTDLMSSIPVKERVKVSQNWRLGRCREGILLKWKCSQMPWMQLEGDSLYISQANFILAYQFRPDGASLNRRPTGVFAGHDEDVCHFVLANSHIISAGGDGKIGIHKIHSTFTVKYSAHEQEVNCVDSKGGIIVSGSRDRTAKVWPLASGRLGQCLHTIQTEDRVWSIAISPLLSSFVTGTACCGHYSPLRIWDLNSGQLLTHLGSDFPPGAGVLDVMYESPFTLLSCGYDTYIRYWDLRASVRKCVMEWEEPHDSTLYCLQTDGNHLLATGSSYYGVVRLWDRRQRACLHAFPLTSTPLSSPVYCLRLTTKHLYAALSYNLHLLDFQSP